MSPRMKFGIVFTQDAPMPTVIEWCKEAEGLGFPVIGIPDSQLLVRDFIVSYTSYVLHTSQTEFIPMCSTRSHGTRRCRQERLFHSTSWRRAGSLWGSGAEIAPPMVSDASRRKWWRCETTSGRYEGSCEERK